MHDKHINLYAVSKNYKANTIDRFYSPSEVNGMPGYNYITSDKIDAHLAIYEYEAPPDYI